MNAMETHRALGSSSRELDVCPWDVKQSNLLTTVTSPCGGPLVLKLSVLFDMVEVFGPPR